MSSFLTPALPARHFWRAVLYLLLIIGLVSGCSFVPGGGDQSSAQTQMAVSVQATVNAQQSALHFEGTVQAQQATLISQAAQATVLAQQATQLAQPQPTIAPVVDLGATQSALDLQATQQAQNVAPPPTEAPPPPEPTVDFKTQMKSASILLYEDIVGRTDLSRYVKKTLDTMGLDYVDVGSAKGNLKSQLLTGGPGGEGWDLIIIAAEIKSGVTGEFFTYVNDALNQGSSVILEVWYLDDFAGGTASTVLARCGVEFQRDWASLPPIKQIIYSLEPSHPIFHDPNEGLTFTDVTSIWAYNWDVGDLIRTKPGSDATLLLGTIATEKDRYGTAVVCVDDQLIMQTFSSHMLTFDDMYPLWENYITHALKVRLLGGE